MLFSGILKKGNPIEQLSRPGLAGDAGDAGGVAGAFFKTKIH